jgi:hypothetical protein
VRLTTAQRSRTLIGTNTDDPQVSGSREDRPLGLSPHWRRFVATALVWYAVAAAFGAAYAVVRLGWPNSSKTPALVVGVLASAPIALAFAWERLTGLKLFGVEVTLSQVVIPVDQTLATALSEQQYFSGNVALFERIESVVGNPDLKLLELNLRTPRDGDSWYWWSTRIYLQAALLEDRTTIQRLVFVEGDSARRYVGMASPGQVRRALGQTSGINLELAYREIDFQVRGTPAAPGQSAVQRLVESWAARSFTKDGQPVSENQAMTRVSPEALRQWVPLETESVEWDQPLDSALLQALVLEKQARFVPLTRNGRLQRVLDADTFARQTATQSLRAKLG